ncbi:MAG: hypothetical protein M1825_002048 [Sarcosagium campestre]|nr:MAG: hypothetical protein M1825_002048 [Sarcosagium campestre]
MAVFKRPKTSVKQLASLTGESLSVSPFIILCPFKLILFKFRHFTSYSSVSAIAQAAEAPSSITETLPHVAPTSAPDISYQPRAGVVLSRAPLITRKSTPFEDAFYLYQRRLNERLALPFTRYFYFKEDTPADLDWKRKQKVRLTAAREIGAYNAWSKEGWNDEVLVGAEESDPEYQANALLKDAVVADTRYNASAETNADEVEKLTSRVTEADRQGDERSLNRKLDRTIYMLVKDEAGRWRFPAAPLLRSESLQRAAERILVQNGGPNMNTWVIGHAPIGHFEFTFPKLRSVEGNTSMEAGEKTFFMKAKIMTGSPNLSDNKFGLTDFKWLSREEIQGAVSDRYWKAVRNMLAER